MSDSRVTGGLGFTFSTGGGDPIDQAQRNSEEYKKTDLRQQGGQSHRRKV